MRKFTTGVTGALGALLGVALAGLAPQAAQAAVTGTTGAVVAVGPPASVALDVLTSDTTAVTFDERRMVLRRAVEVDLTGPGEYRAAPASTARIPAGTCVQSHLVHADATGGAGATDLVTFDGSVTFDQPVIGVVTSNAGLDASDGVLGRLNTAYPADHGNRGVEFTQDEWVRWCECLNQVDFHLAVTNHVDAFRVLTRC